MSKYTEEKSKRLIDLFFIIDPSKFHYLKFILEGYDNLAVLSSVDRKRGVIRVKTTSYLYNELLELINQIAWKIKKPLL